MGLIFSNICRSKCVKRPPFKEPYIPEITIRDLENIEYGYINDFIDNDLELI